MSFNVSAAAAQLGVRPATLRSWDQRYGMTPSQRSDGGHRRYTERDMARLRFAAGLIEHGQSTASAIAAARDLTEAHVDRLLKADTSQTPNSAVRDVKVRAQESSSVLSRLRRATRALDGGRVHELLQSYFDAYGTERVWQDLAVPILKEIGENWSTTGAGVDVEHVVSQAITRVLDIDSEVSEGRPILLACAPDEQHCLALVALRAVLIERGQTVVYLGARVPGDALAHAVGRIRPRHVVIWATVQPPVHNIGLLVPPLRRPSSKVLLAGPGWDQIADSRRFTMLDSLAGALNELCE